MTFADRVRALTPCGFTERQAAFVVTVALHGGYCMRRQYAAFTRQQGGRNVTDFLDQLVDRGLARPCTFRRDRGRIYHLHAKSIYRAIAQQDNRNRRHAGPALIARKLMLLDLVLSHPTREWYATEADKVELFVDRLGVPAERLPRRIYHGVAGGPVQPPHTTRYCVQKLPVFLADDPRRPHFVCLITQRPSQAIEAFLREQASLLTHLPSWPLLACGPRHVADEVGCAAAFDRALRALVPHAGIDHDLRWFFETRRRIEQGQLGTLSVAEVHRFRECRARWQHTQDPRYAAWLTSTDAALPSDARSAPVHAPAPELLTHWLPFRYDQFGSHPGIA